MDRGVNITCVIYCEKKSIVVIFRNFILGCIAQRGFEQAVPEQVVFRSICNLNSLTVWCQEQRSTQL